MDAVRAGKVKFRMSATCNQSEVHGFVESKLVALESVTMCSGIHSRHDKGGQRGSSSCCHPSTHRTGTQPHTRNYPKLMKPTSAADEAARDSIHVLGRSIAHSWTDPFRYPPFARMLAQRIVRTLRLKMMQCDNELSDCALHSISRIPWPCWHRYMVCRRVHARLPMFGHE